MTKKLNHLKNIAMVAYAFPPFNYSGTERPFQFAKHLPEFGYLPFIISQDNYINYHIAANDSEKLEQLNPKTIVYRLKTIKSQLEDTRIIKWFDIRLQQLTGKVKILSRVLYMPFQLTVSLFEWELRSVFKIVYLKWTKGITLIWATGPAWQDLTVGYWASRLTGLPYIMDLRDPMTYGLLWQPKHINESKKLLKREYRYLKHAKKVVFTSPLTEKKYIARYPNVLKEKTCFITNGFDADSLTMNLHKLRNDKFVLSYIGRLTDGIRDPEFFLEGFKMASNNSGFAENVELIMIGYIEDFVDIIESYNNHGNIKITKVVPRKESLELMMESDVLIIIQSIQGEGSDVISGKLFEYLNARKHVIGVVDEQGGDSWLIQQTGCGMVTGLEKVSNVAEALLKVYDLWENKKLSELHNKDYSQFNRNHLTKNLAAVFNGLLDES